ncbi:unnamed protein product [Cylindrotheca closterium]|uniref:Opine dehydrogenase domain-containing protein n=1 Tax=Cylindrotheca closterium TaxID=2856 RepID=A0AAD2FL20_9STRA|nr:unnamed protein product [Cylindrotheca closterium]
MLSLVPERPQTTVLVGGSNGTKTLQAILCDRTNPLNDGHVVRVVTRSPSQFADEQGKPKHWKCNEQHIRCNEVPLTIFPESLMTSWKTHMGAADSVLGYSDEDDPDEFGDAFDKAISGIGTMDDGGIADCIVLCCPVFAHLPILRRIARSLYRLDRKGLLLKSAKFGGNAPPLLVGSLYAAGGLDWQSRVAFAQERPSDFCGTWKRDLCLFGFKAFPFLAKSTEPGVVTLFGRFPELLVALSPPSPRARARARILLDRLLQAQTTGRYCEFLGIGAKEKVGGDGTAPVVDAAAAVAVAQMMQGTHKVGSSNVMLGKTSAKAISDTLPSDIMAKPMADYADPTGSIAFLTCTMNATNQWLHPCIMAAMFKDPNNPEASDKDGRIPWPLKEKKTPLPRFYSDGAAHPEAGQLITSIACAEVYPLLDSLDAFLSPSGMRTISSMHGGEPVGRMVVNTLGNSPAEIGERSGLTELVLKRAQGIPNSEDELPQMPSKDRLRFYNFFAFSMGFGLSHSHRIGHVLSPAERIKDENGNPTDYIRPIPTSRFFVDDLNHGLCVQLGLGEMFGFDLERDMPATLYVVRRLQKWMGKEFVLPSKQPGKKLVADARDLAETSTPQGFGVNSIQELRSFLQLSPIGEDGRILAEQRVLQSPLVGNQPQIRSKL